jgi:hypothetical protein
MFKRPCEGSVLGAADVGRVSAASAKTSSRKARGTWKLRFPVGDHARNSASFSGSLGPPGLSMRKTLKRQRSPGFGGSAVPAGAFDASAVQGRNATAVQPFGHPAASLLVWTRLSSPAAFQSLSNRLSGRSTHRSTTAFTGFHSISAYERPVAPTSRKSSTTSSFHRRSSRRVSVCQGDGSVTS